MEIYQWLMYIAESTAFYVFKFNVCVKQVTNKIVFHIIVGEEQMKPGNEWKGQAGLFWIGPAGVTPIKDLDKAQNIVAMWVV